MINKIDKKVAAPIIALTLKNTVDAPKNVHQEECYNESPEFQQLFNFDMMYEDGSITESSLSKNIIKVFNQKCIFLIKRNLHQEFFKYYQINILGLSQYQPSVNYQKSPASQYW